MGHKEIYCTRDCNLWIFPLTRNILCPQIKDQTSNTDFYLPHRRLDTSRATSIVHSNTSIFCKLIINNYRWSITVRMVNNSLLCNRRFRPETTEDSALSQVSHISGRRWLTNMKERWHDRQRKTNGTLKPSVRQYQFIHHESQRTSPGTETQAVPYKGGA